ncbi:PREDICTED: origin of replication complex subunit 5-like isoform X2 [Ipomoea nil]|uniref:origin of replication complex subunit 5-like isoform X1 n=1 Tax=Ipomoea nil TaxID=35883 RepID=UPI000900FE64|nr:PREDICTED: origin of replication complex subunit 5-like isoform X1 [Ipomoea nil]XP_019181736.1 PREDICTED: origin of replication complex subunit 5-like isoform X1 [Ipomoea nil]XP_019181737.1 PREDICTED: origin of replication complex subunit 5-like isoform X1 [Ipomoea nil]XP_019181738.1 PREDICTED: origin of replication complex subunit 5-like isoform X1 [Ipomoea nil]XP_019181739.1 PREDICTED: origin of replication complex subunit 5-like isoform X1 [Ipomoea nil]XP_019181741.1 PREDICTED: origin of
MGEVENPQITRRTTRLSSFSSSGMPNPKNVELESKPLTINDLAFGNESINFDELMSSLHGRRPQIRELLRLLGPLNSPISPIFMYGGASVGKTSTILQIFKYLKRPFVYCSCITCYSPRILFESVLNQLLLHRRTESNGYSSAKRCDKPSDFVNLLREALVKVVEDLKMNAEKSGSKKSAQRTSGRMVYLIFDNLERIREWNKSEILPFLFKLYDVLKMPEVGLIFVSATSPDTYYSDTGCVEPVHVYFPDYTDDDLHQIFTRRSPGNSKLYSSFLEAVLRPFCRVTRRVDELSTAFSSLFQIYCEGVDDLGAVPDEHMKNRLYCHLKPHIGPAMNEVFKVLSRPSPEVATNKIKRKVVPTKDGFGESCNEVDFHMSDCAKYLLISAFIASRNPATLDASLFDSTGGCSSRKRKRKSSQKSMEQKEIAEQESVMKGPGTFPLERLLAIFQCITSVSEYSTDEEAETGRNNNNNGLMCDVLLQLSSLCNANFISKGGSCPLEGSLRYRSMVSEDLALKVARTLKFPLSKYLYR